MRQRSGSTASMTETKRQVDNSDMKLKSVVDGMEFVDFSD
jgi:hypothetical protein